MPCSAWFFPGNQNSATFLLDQIDLPSAFTIEAKVKREGASTGSRYIFSLEKTIDANCVLLKDDILPDDNKFHIVTVTSAGETMVDGVVTSGTALEAQTPRSPASASLLRARSATSLRLILYLCPALLGAQAVLSMRIAEPLAQARPRSASQTIRTASRT